jgi:hypothetical protein
MDIALIKETITLRKYMMPYLQVLLVEAHVQVGFSGNSCLKDWIGMGMAMKSLLRIVLQL